MVIKIMNPANDNDLEQVTGGGNAAWIGITIAAVFIFLSGVIEGFTNPGRCKS